MSTAKVTLALMAGMAAGATLGILFAPQTGGETRDRLSESLSNLGETLKETAARQIGNLMENFKTKIVEAVKSGISRQLAPETADDLEHA